MKFSVGTTHRSWAGPCTMRSPATDWVTLETDSRLAKDPSPRTRRGSLDLRADRRHLQPHQIAKAAWSRFMIEARTFERSRTADEGPRHRPAPGSTRSDRRVLQQPVNLSHSHQPAPTPANSDQSEEGRAKSHERRGLRNRRRRRAADAAEAGAAEVATAATGVVCGAIV